jgi:hypothetical protein
LRLEGDWSVRLGFLEGVRHTYEHSAEDPLQLWGSASHGIQIVALAHLFKGTAQAFR